MRKIILSVFLLCLFLTVCAQVFPALPAEADNGIPVLSVTIDPDELQKVLESPDHSCRVQGCSVREDKYYFSVSAKNSPVASTALYNECKSSSAKTLKV